MYSGTYFAELFHIDRERKRLRLGGIRSYAPLSDQILNIPPLAVFALGTSDNHPGLSMLNSRLIIVFIILDAWLFAARSSSILPSRIPGLGSQA
ncbi:hypothetical protein KIPB_016045 [Kipferlia bialata]|uniref:Uncharacterized protein n=1 Tax=Kipferlia bialata TaxID=797122 RepID=A0A9K3GR27_9EUKA|nr:hypothetical protein KIPB_016045 [Kipferlia bialata]|eukprot:g16045.t1